MMNEIILLIFLIGYSSCSYIAAIASHNILSTGQNIPQQNLNLYSQHVFIAKSKSAQIIVFPEFGLCGVSSSSRQQIANTCSELFPNVNSNPCLNPNLKSNTSIIQQLSCLARKFKLVIVVNYNDKVNCQHTGCNRDNYYLYNTDIVFDESGKIIAKYYKTHPWFTSVFDTPSPPSLVTFTTSFGVKFGLMICYDILFDFPGPQLVKKYNITHFPYALAQNIVGPVVVKLWTYTYHTTILSANLGEFVGFYQYGNTLDHQSYSLNNSTDYVVIGVINT